MRKSALATAVTLALSCVHSMGLSNVKLLAVDGITIGSTRAEGIEAFGEPLQSVTDYDDIMGTGKNETLTYEGATVEVIQPDANAAHGLPPYVAGIEISTPRWRTASGLRVGSAVAEVLRVLGPPARSEGDAMFWYTKGFDGHIKITFTDGRVDRISYDEDWT